MSVKTLSHTSKHLFNNNDNNTARFIHYHLMPLVAQQQLYSILLK